MSLKLRSLVNRTGSLQIQEKAPPLSTISRKRAKLWFLELEEHQQPGAFQEVHWRCLKHFRTNNSLSSGR